MTRHDQEKAEADNSKLHAAEQLDCLTLTEGHETLYAALEDGFTVVRLISPAALDRELAQMQHGIGGKAYHKKLNDPKNLYLSLRDSHGKPCATLEVISGKLTRLQSERRQALAPKYRDALVPFLKAAKWKMEIPVSRLGYVVDVHGEWHEFDKLPIGFTVDGDLDLSDTSVTILPEGLTVDGDLDLSDTSVTILPEGLTVGRCLVLERSSIAQLPKGLVVGMSLYLRDTPLTSLPDDLRHVAGNLDLQGTRIKALPKDLRVDGYLCLVNTPIEELPEGLTVGSDLFLHGTAVTSIPDSVSSEIIVFIADHMMAMSVFRETNMKDGMVTAEISGGVHTGPMEPFRFRELAN